MNNKCFTKKFRLLYSATIELVLQITAGYLYASGLESILSSARFISYITIIIMASITIELASDLNQNKKWAINQSVAELLLSAGFIIAVFLECSIFRFLYISGKSNWNFRYSIRQILANEIRLNIQIIVTGFFLIVALCKLTRRNSFIRIWLRHRFRRYFTLFHNRNDNEAYDHCSFHLNLFISQELGSDHTENISRKDSDIIGEAYYKVIPK